MIFARVLLVLSTFTPHRCFEVELAATVWVASVAVEWGMGHLVRACKTASNLSCECRPTH